MQTTADPSKGPSRKQIDRRLSAGLGVSGVGVIFDLLDKRVPWWGVLLWSTLALAVITIQSVVPQESKDRVDVIRAYFRWCRWRLEKRSDHPLATRTARIQRGTPLKHDADKGSGA